MNKDFLKYLNPDSEIGRYYIKCEEERISKIISYFNDLRCYVLSRVVPSIIIKPNEEIEYKYSEDTIKLLNEINKLELEYYGSK